MQERLNGEIRRRERVIRIFPNDEAATRLVGALLIDVYESWQERRYLEMADYHEWRERCAPRRSCPDVWCTSGGSASVGFSR